MKEDSKPSSLFMTETARLVCWFTFLLGISCLVTAAVLAYKNYASYKDFLMIGVGPVFTGLFGLLARTRSDPEVSASSNGSTAKVDPNPQQDKPE